MLVLWISQAVAQKAIVDPLYLGMSLAGSSMQNSALKDIKEKTEQIMALDIAITYENQKLRGITEKLYKGSSEVSNAFKSAEMLMLLLEKVDRTKEYTRKTYYVAQKSRDPLLMALALKLETNLIKEALGLISTSNLLYIGGDKNMLMNSGQRMELLARLVDHASDMFKMAYHAWIVVKTAERIGAEKYLLPSQIDLTVDTKAVAKQVLQQINSIK